MSRSYKKTPVCKEGNRSKKWGKRKANRKVRKTTGLGGKSNLYRKAYESWNICDYRTFKERDVNMKEKDLNFWKKWYLRK